MDGFRVMKMDDAAPLGDIFVTATGCRDVITRRHFEKMKNDAIVANSGHFDVEYNLNDLAAMSVEHWERKPFIEGYRLADGRIITAQAAGAAFLFGLKLVEALKGPEAAEKVRGGVLYRG